MIRKAEIELEYQHYIPAPPVQASVLYQNACSNDSVTINAWRDKWLNNIKTNHEKYGPFKDKAIGQLFASEQYKPVIVAGAGPSLKHNAHELRAKRDICLVSCLHNFHFMEEIGAKVDYYVTLDAGDVTIEEVSEGGSQPPDYYWDLTKDKTLLAFIGTSPGLLEKWQGEVLFFSCPVPDEVYIKKSQEIEKFNQNIGTGGNVLGACLYIAKALLGAGTVAFIGADFCFSYDHKFHAWSSKYDADLGHTIKAIDVFGIPVITWQSYNNFKQWFDYVSIKVPGFFINCTEGGTLGSYREGNIASIQQMPLKQFIEQMNLFYSVEVGFKDPVNNSNVLLF